MNYSIKENKLVINNDIEIEFLYNVAKVVQFEDIYVCLLSPPLGEKMNENITCVTSKGEVLWIVEKIIPEEKDFPYVDIMKRGDKLIASSWAGFRVGIRLENGKIAWRRITK